MSRDMIGCSIEYSQGVVFDTEAAHAVLMADPIYRRMDLNGRPLFRAHDGHFQMREEHHPDSWRSHVYLPDDLPETWLAILSRHLREGEVTLLVTEMPDDPSQPRHTRAYWVTPGQVHGEVASLTMRAHACLIVDQGRFLSAAQRQRPIPNGPVTLTEEDVREDLSMALSVAQGTPVFVGDQAVLLSRTAYEALIAAR